MIINESFIRLVESFRDELENYLNVNNVSISTDPFNDPGSQFPKASCKGAAFILGQFLIEELKMKDVYYVWGFNTELGAHGWTEVDDHILDLTADQFAKGRKKVIIVKKHLSDFHRAFKNQQRFGNSIGKDHDFRKILSKVSDRINSMYNVSEFVAPVNSVIENKEQLFHKYSKNLQLVASFLFPEKLEQLKGKYVCPICFRDFTIEQLETHTGNHLTEEHIPPQSVGWKRKVLTCKECNNTQGGQLDSQLTKLLLTKAFNKKIPGTSVTSRFTIGENIQLNGTASIKEDGGLHINIDQKRSNPTDFQNVKRALENSDIPEIHFEWKTGEMKKALISMVRAAYLWGFSEFGYGFVFNNNFVPVREQILYPDRDLYFDKYVLGGSFPKEWEGIHIIDEPTEAEGYAFIMNLNAYGLSDEICVLLPGADEEALQRLATLKELIKVGAPDLSFVPLVDPEVVHHPEKCIYILSYWFEKYPIE